MPTTPMFERFAEVLELRLSVEFHRLPEAGGRVAIVRL